MDNVWSLQFGTFRAFLEFDGLKYETASASAAKGPSPMAIRHSCRKLFKVFTAPNSAYSRTDFSIIGERERANLSI